MRRYNYLSMTFFFLIISCGEDISDIKNIENGVDDLNEGDGQDGINDNEIYTPIHTSQPFYPGSHAIISQRPDNSNIGDESNNELNNDIIEETIVFPSGLIVNHEGIETKIKPFRMFKSVISTDKVWNCIVDGGCDTFNFFSGAGEQFMSCSSKSTHVKGTQFTL